MNQFEKNDLVIYQFTAGTREGFKINNDSSTNEHFLDDDGQGNVRVYYLSQHIAAASHIYI